MSLLGQWTTLDILPSLALRQSALEALAYAPLALATGLMALHLASFILAWPWSRRAPRASAPAAAEPVTVVRVLCGVEPTSQATLLGTLDFDYPDTRPIFCVARGDDPIIPLVRQAMAARPQSGARLLIGEDRVSANPKLNNMIKAWRVADTDLVLFLDSNLVAPADYVARAVAAMGDATMASAPPIGLEPDNFAADVEAAFLNAHAARWQYAAGAVGLGFAQGKTLLFSRKRLPLGDLSILGREPAEDAAATCLARAHGGRVTLIPGPAGQRLGKRPLAGVWRRQLRWAKLRRATFPGLFALEIASGGAMALAAAALAFHALGAPWLLAGYALLWWGSELAFARLCGWPVSLLGATARDFMVPALWVAAWAGGAVAWHGAVIPLNRGGEVEQAGDPATVESA